MGLSGFLHQGAILLGTVAVTLSSEMGHARTYGSIQPPISAFVAARQLSPIRPYATGFPGAPLLGVHRGELQCVPFARQLSRIALIGDAWTWWHKAAGLFERGNRPQPGSVLAFTPDTRMPLGHVAVVTRLIAAREIEIDHANWAAPGAISRGVPVIDISEGNDWTAVRVGLGHGPEFGRAYQTHGFIYDRPPQAFAAGLFGPEDQSSFYVPSLVLGAAAGPLPVVVYGSSPRRPADVQAVAERLPRVIYGESPAASFASPRGAARPLIINVAKALALLAQPSQYNPGSTRAVR